jgi:hypothetical protein
MEVSFRNRAVSTCIVLRNDDSKQETDLPSGEFTNLTVSNSNKQNPFREMPITAQQSKKFLISGNPKAHHLREQFNLLRRYAVYVAYSKQTFHMKMSFLSSGLQNKPCRR